MKSTKIQEDN